MFSTVDKITTKRRASAQAILNMPEAFVETLRLGETPKGDALEIARAAGILAAKKTGEMIPFCHPIPIDQIRIEYELQKNTVKIISHVEAIWKTGVEMEALMAAQMTALVLFDMLKPLGTEMSITDVRVLSKRGGKSDFKEALPENFKAAVIVSSDGTYAGTREDKSGKIILERLRRVGVEHGDYLILPDDEDKIRAALLDFCEKHFHLIITTGGTGLGPRDVTVEATKSVIEKEIPGIMEAARHFGQSRTPYAMLSRGVAGLRGQTLILNLPGSSNGTRESLDALIPALLHTYKMMAGGGH